MTWFNLLIIAYLSIGVILAASSQNLIKLQMITKFMQNKKEYTQAELSEAVILFSLFLTISWGPSLFVSWFGMKK